MNVFEILREQVTLDRVLSANGSAKAVVGAWTSRQIDDESPDDFDFSNMTDDELRQYIVLSEKLGIRHKRPRD